MEGLLSTGPTTSSYYTLGDILIYKYASFCPVYSSLCPVYSSPCPVYSSHWPVYSSPSTRVIPLFPVSIQNPLCFSSSGALYSSQRLHVFLPLKGCPPGSFASTLYLLSCIFVFLGNCVFLESLQLPAALLHSLKDHLHLVSIFKKTEEKLNTFLENRPLIHS